MSKRLKILFGFSLLLNLVVLGAVIGFTMRGHWMQPNRLALKSHGFERIIEKVSDSEKREALQQRFRSLRKARKVNGLSIQENRAKIRSVVNTEPFDTTVYQKNIRMILEKKHDTELAYALLLGEVTEALPAEERHRALRLLYRGGGKKHRRKHD